MSVLAVPSRTHAIRSKRLGEIQTSVTHSRVLFRAGTNTLWHGPEQDGQIRRLCSYLQLGTADGDISPYQHHRGAGVVLQGQGTGVPRTPSDSPTPGYGFLRSLPAHFEYPAETIFESYHKAAFIRHVALFQDFQFVHHPGALRANPD